MKYAWRIDRDELKLPPSRVGTIGPRAAHPALVDRLAKGEGRRFRMLDDDGIVYYIGRIIVAETAQGADEPGTTLDFAPLDDFGMPDSGCTAIEYDEGDAWVAL